MSRRGMILTKTLVPCSTAQKEPKIFRPAQNNSTRSCSVRTWSSTLSTCAKSPWYRPRFSRTHCTKHERGKQNECRQEFQAREIRAHSSTHVAGLDVGLRALHRQLRHLRSPATRKGQKRRAKQ